MPDTAPATRAIDPVALARVRRRLSLNDEPPWLHGEVARRMAERLEWIRLKPTRIVEWWPSIGGGSALLAKTYPEAPRALVEPDAARAARTRAALPSRRWPWQRGPAIEVVADDGPLPAGAQLLWANMSLHLVADAPALFERWQPLLAQDGFLMFSGLGPGTLAPLRALYAELGLGEPMAPFVDMHDYGDMLVHAGFADPVMDQEVITLSWPDADALLRELRTLGGNASVQRFPAWRTPRWRERLRAALGSLAGADGRISLPFEVAYGHAIKGAPRMRVGEATTIAVDDLRAMARATRRGR